MRIHVPKEIDSVLLWRAHGTAKIVPVRHVALSGTHCGPPGTARGDILGMLACQLSPEPCEGSVLLHRYVSGCRLIIIEEYIEAILDDAGIKPAWQEALSLGWNGKEDPYDLHDQAELSKLYDLGADAWAEMRTPQSDWEHAASEAVFTGSAKKLCRAVADGRLPHPIPEFSDTLSELVRQYEHTLAFSAI